MSSSVVQGRSWRPRWHTTLVLVSAVVVFCTLLVSTTALLPMGFTTALAVLAGTGFVLGVSASISAFLERDANADSDFWR